MPTVRFTLDPTRPPALSAATAARIDALTDAEREAAALADPDNPPMTEEELARVRAAQIARLARTRAGLTQAAFAKRFRITLGRLRDIEQGRGRPDPAVVAYLAMIADAPERAQRVVDGL